MVHSALAHALALIATGPPALYILCVCWCVQYWQSPQFSEYLPRGRFQWNLAMNGTLWATCDVVVVVFFSSCIFLMNQQASVSLYNKSKNSGIRLFTIQWSIRWEMWIAEHNRWKRDSHWQLPATRTMIFNCHTNNTRHIKRLKTWLEGWMFVVRVRRDPNLIFGKVMVTTTNVQNTQTTDVVSSSHIIEISNFHRWLFDNMALCLSSFLSLYAHCSCSKHIHIYIYIDNDVTEPLNNLEWCHVHA